MWLAAKVPRGHSRVGEPGHRCISSPQSKLAVPSTQPWFYRQQKRQEFRGSWRLTPSFQKATEARQGQIPCKEAQRGHGTKLRKWSLKKNWGYPDSGDAKPWDVSKESHRHPVKPFSMDQLKNKTSPRESLHALGWHGRQNVVTEALWFHHMLDLTLRYLVFAVLGLGTCFGPIFPCYIPPLPFGM